MDNACPVAVVADSICSCVIVSKVSGVCVTACVCLCVVELLSKLSCTVALPLDLHLTSDWCHNAD